MAYFKINGIDYSLYVNKLKVLNTHQYNAQVNAAGNTVIDYINRKRSITVGIIPLDKESMLNLQSQIKELNASITFLNPETGELEENINCILPQSEIDYYTIQVDKTLYNGFELTFTEL